MTPRKARTTSAKPDKVMRDAILFALNREAEDASGAPATKLSLIADRLVDKAVDGDMAAIKEVLDRTDGKTVQSVDAPAQALEDMLERLDAARP
ncbi:MAG: hypothetical protein HY243_15905 [Proteobacteria bacterium]|nr:hypothetical protein [Pseudomonadota bacterium]